jgi:hypothetical protein
MFVDYSSVHLFINWVYFMYVFILFCFFILRFVSILSFAFTTEIHIFLWMLNMDNWF